MRWRKLFRSIAAWSVGPPLVIVSAVIGTMLVLLYSPPGRAITVRALTQFISGSIAGQVSIGSIRGSIFRHVVMEDVAVHDSTGAMLARVPRLEARYLLPELLAGRIVIRELDLRQPEVHIARLRRGRWSYQEVFRAGGGGDGPPPRVELRSVVVHDATIRVDVPITPGPPKQPISARGAMPAQPEITDGSDGPVRIYRARGVNARLPLVRISTPEDDPILVEIASLSGRLSDPDLSIVALEGQVVTKADSLRFNFSEAALPGTVVHGSGAVRWPQDTIRYDFALDADTVALRDLRWIQPDFPDWTGRGSVVALSTTNRHSEFVLENLQLGDSSSRAAGRLVAILDVDRGFGVRDLDLVLDNVSLEVARPYLDTLPLSGWATGRLKANGYQSLMQLSGSVAFRDGLTPRPVTSTFDFSGSLAMGEGGATFRNFVLTESSVDLATVTAQVPAVALPGRMRLVGRLDGPFQDVTFQGTAEHESPEGALSRMIGTVRLDTRRDPLALEMDARFDRLSFDGLRSGYPALTPRGGVSGRVIASGPLDSLAIDADLTGDIGDVVARGVIGATAPRYRFENLLLDVRRLDVDAVIGRGGNTAINGLMVINGVIDSGVAPVGNVRLDLGQSRIEGITLAGVSGDISSDGRLMTFDSLRADWASGSVRAEGTLGWTAADSGSLHVEAAGFSLEPFDSLARAKLKLEPDSLNFRRLGGTASLRVDVLGSLEDPAIDGRVEAEQVQIDDWTLRKLTADVRADSLSSKGIQLDATVDSIGKGRQLGTDVHLVVGGSADSLSAAVSGNLRDSRLSLGGWRIAQPDGDQLGIDSLRLDLPRQQWTLDRPAVLTVTDRIITLSDTMVLSTVDGSGLMMLSGAVPGSGTAELSASVIGLDLADIYAVMGRDTAEVGGIAQVDFRLSGTRNAPLLRGNAMVTGPRFGEANPPLLRAAYDYADRTARANVAFWRLGEPVLEIDATVPFDLALAPRTQRRLPGPIEIRATADSAELAIIEAFTNSVRSTTGAMSLDLTVGGTWDDPRLSGTAAVYDGRTTIPNLGVRYSPIRGTATFDGDSLIVERLTLASDEGELAIEGSVRFEDLQRTSLNLELTSRRFLAINVPGFLVARPTGTVTLTGSLTRPVLRGNSITISSSDVYFADIINKNVLDLEDPAYRDFVDIDEIRRLGLGTAFQNRFLDSLRIENLRVVVGSDVWLRSAEAEIQLEGSVQVSKTGKDYNVAGTLDTPRGEYTLNFRGIISRKFTIERGTVTYLGTSDLNAELDLQASYLVRAYDGDEIPVVARITGTIQVPRVELSSPGRDLPEREILSYLVFGRSEFQLAGNTAGQAGREYLLQAWLTALSGEFERTLVQESGLGLDLFEIRPGIPARGTDVGSFTSVAAGVQLGPRWFVTVNAGFCLGGGQQESLSARNFGASVEYRIARDWRAQASAEPVQSCIGTRLGDGFNNIPRRYQLGGDLLWEREY